MKYLLTLILLAMSTSCFGWGANSPSFAITYSPTDPDPVSHSFYWDCNSATSAVDGSNNPITLTSYGAVGFLATGGFDDGGYLNLSYSPTTGYHSGIGFAFTAGTVANTTSGTIDVYLRADDTIQDDVIILYTGSTELLGIYMNTYSNSTIRIDTNATSRIILDPPNTDVWRHLILNWENSGETLSGSLDGTPFTTVTGLPVFSAQFSELWFGHRNNTGAAVARVDEVHVYSEVQP